MQQQPHSTHPEPSSQRPQRGSSRKSPYDEGSDEEGIIRRPRKKRKVGQSGTSMDAQGGEGKRPAQSKARNEVEAIVEMVQRLPSRSRKLLMDTITGKTSSKKDGVSRVKTTVGGKLKDVVVGNVSSYFNDSLPLVPSGWDIAPPANGD